MTTIINDHILEERLIAQRQQAGLDKLDEVWGGVYVMSPMANNEHQRVVSDLTTILNIVLGWSGLGRIFPGVNVSDQEDDWKNNYRCPDVAVYLKDTQAEDRGAYWYGGPDFAVEVVSPQDRTTDKLPFYGQVGTRELLVVDRDPWALSLYRLRDEILQPFATSELDGSTTIVSEVVPLDFNMLAHESRPVIEVNHHDRHQRWIIDPTAD
ncbi:MAG: Uma2 family endonuclease [Planctomycetes bacterium]|nr:Uma2 family endonuclease [Planctomycetota bacterium]